MKRTTKVVTAIWAVALLAIATDDAAAQGRGSQSTEPAYNGPMQVLSLNPFGIVAEWFNLEYERRINRRFTLGAAASYVPNLDRDESYASLNALVRHYPSGKALQGFFFGARTGLYNVDDGRGNELLYGLGFELGYTWLLGEADSFQISLGAGASRIWGGTVDGSTAIPTVRLVNVGLAF